MPSKSHVAYQAIREHKQESITKAQFLDFTQKIGEEHHWKDIPFLIQSLQDVVNLINSANWSEWGEEFRALQSRLY